MGAYNMFKKSLAVIDPRFVRQENCGRVEDHDDNDDDDDDD